MKSTDDFFLWIDNLDRSIRMRVDQRLQRLNSGNPGFHKRFDGILELKWKAGVMGSFRVYLTEVEGFILLLGGHKDKQSKDIKLAKKILLGVKDGTTRIQDYE